MSGARGNDNNNDWQNEDAETAAATTDPEFPWRETFDSYRNNILCYYVPVRYALYKLIDLGSGLLLDRFTDRRYHHGYYYTH